MGNYETQQEQKRVYAGFWIRFVASLLDSIIVGIPIAIIMIIIMISVFGAAVGFDVLLDPAYMENEMTDEQALLFIGAYLLSILVSFILTVLYYAGMHASKWQGTVGKKLLGLIVTDIKGQRISFWRAFGRYLAMAFLSSIFMIGYIIAAFTEKKQSLHDLIAGTVVLKK
ncbi:RDD family protein [Neobacillus sp. D3-1R]|uniref:RDD family protein n=1 Tax=Neobacillus sp. D3-1R TaxID=3445778 RepID=UPI003FA14B36